MPIAPINPWVSAEWFRIVIAVVGLLSIFLGYRLFCGVSAQKSGKLANFASGALLALFGMVALVAGVVGASGAPSPSSHPEWQKKSAQHRLFAPEKVKEPVNTVDRSV